MEIHNVKIGYGDAMLIFQAGVSRGPDHGPVVKYAAPEALPFFALSLLGVVPVADNGRGFNANGEHIVMGVLPFQAAASLHATMLEIVAGWPEQDQTRFRAQVDQQRHEYRQAERDYRERGDNDE